MKKICLGLLAAAFFSMAISTGLSAKTKVVFWHTMNNEESETLNPILSEFTKLHPEIDLHVQYVSFGEALNKFKIAALAGDGPDVFRSDIGWVAELAKMGVLEPLDKLVSLEDQKDYLDAAMRYFKYSGKTWGVPQVTDSLALLYNKKLFQAKNLKEPQTMQEFITAAQQLTDEKKGLYGFAMIPKGYFLLPFIWSYGGDLVDEKSRQVLIKTAEATAGMQAFIDLALKYKVTGPSVDFVNGYTNAITGFKEGKYAMMINGPWSIAEVLTGSAFKDAENLGVAVIPKGPQGQSGSPIGGHGYVVYRGSKNIPAAYTLIDFLNKPKNQVRFALEKSLLPTRQSVYDGPELKKQVFIQKFWAQLQASRSRPVIPEGALLYKALDDNLQSVMKNKASSDTAIESVAKAWKRLLKQKL